MLAVAFLMLLPGEIETIASPDFSKPLQVSAVTATVRIVNVSRGTKGSGAIIRSSGPFVYVLTARHVVDKAERLEVHVFSAASYPKPENVYRSAEVIARMKGLSDLALVRFSTSDRMPGTVRVCPAGAVPKEKSFPVLTAGCDDGNSPTCGVDVAEKKPVRKPSEGETGFLWEVSRKPNAGRSGGPLIDKRGYLVGVCSGRNEGKGYYCHTEAIHEFLRQNGVKWLYEEER